MKKSCVEWWQWLMNVTSKPLWLQTRTWIDYRNKIVQQCSKPARMWNEENIQIYIQYSAFWRHLRWQFNIFSCFFFFFLFAFNYSDIFIVWPHSPNWRLNFSFLWFAVRRKFIYFFLETHRLDCIFWTWASNRKKYFINHKRCRARFSTFRHKTITKI